MTHRILWIAGVFVSVISCKTVSPVAVPRSEMEAAAANRAKIYSCSDTIQAAQASPEQPLAGRYIVTAFGDSGTLTWIAKAGEDDIHDADCRYDENIKVTTCETFTESQIKKNGEEGPIWAFTIDHANGDDVRIFGFKGTLAQFKATGKEMPLLGVIKECPDESKRDKN